MFELSQSAIALEFLRHEILQLSHNGFEFSVHRNNPDAGLPLSPVKFDLERLTLGGDAGLDWLAAQLLEKLLIKCKPDIFVAVPRGGIPVAQRLSLAHQNTQRHYIPLLLTEWTTRNGERVLQLTDAGWHTLKGRSEPFSSAVVVEDVTTTCGSAATAADLCTRLDLPIAGMVSLLSWDVGGEEWFEEKYSAPAVHLLTAMHILNELQNMLKIETSVLTQAQKFQHAVTSFMRA